MRKLGFILLITALITSTAWAGGSIFGGHKTRTSNPDGVSSIGIHICGSLNCPDVILKTGDCGAVEHATTKYGVCVCDEGYRASGDHCDSCPDGQYSNGMTGCQKCPDEYAATCDSSGKTLNCIEGYYEDNLICKSYELKINAIVDAISTLYDVAIASSSDTLNYTDAVGDLPEGCSQMVYDNEVVIAGIKNQEDCDQVKTKLGDKITGGDCSSKTDGAYALTVTLGEAPFVWDISSCGSTLAECKALCEAHGGNWYYDGFDDCCWNKDNEGCCNYISNQLEHKDWGTFEWDGSKCVDKNIDCSSCGDGDTCADASLVSSCFYTGTGFTSECHKICGNMCMDEAPDEAFQDCCARDTCITK